jgi:hypothetical protein
MDGSPYADKHEPEFGCGDFYAEAETIKDGPGFEVGLFTPHLNLTGYSTLNISFNYDFKNYYTFLQQLLNKYPLVNISVNAYIGGNSSEEEKEILWSTNKEESGYGELSLNLSKYSQIDNVYIEFYFNDHNYTDKSLLNILLNLTTTFHSFNIDDIVIICDNGSGNWVEFLNESFEGSSFPPSNWTQFRYNSTRNGNWTKEYYTVDVDLMSEIYVGRAPVGNLKEVSNFVKKTLAYEKTKGHDPYLKKALLVGEDLSKDFNESYLWGKEHKEEVDGYKNIHYPTYGIPNETYDIDKLYDRDWIEEKGWPISEIKKRINNNVSNIKMFAKTYYVKNFLYLNILRKFSIVRFSFL